MVLAFASHAWGVDGKDHMRVKDVVEALRARGIEVWFDETHMHKYASIPDAMCQGIDKSDVVLVFVTADYCEKTASGNGQDNVRKEFLYAQSRKPEAMIPIKFDEALPRAWPGPVGMQLGAQLYVDLSQGEHERNLDRLAESVRYHTPAQAKSKGQPGQPVQPERARSLGPKASATWVAQKMRPPETLQPPEKSKVVQPSQALRAPQALRRPQASRTRTPQTLRALQVWDQAPRAQGAAVKGAEGQLSVKERVERTLTVAGCRLGDGERSGAAVNRLLCSFVVGSVRQAEVLALPFTDRLAHLELQLGVA